MIQLITTTLITLILILVPYRLGYEIMYRSLKKECELEYDMLSTWAVGLVLILSTIIIYIICHYIGSEFLKELRVQLN